MSASRVPNQRSTNNSNDTTLWNNVNTTACSSITHKSLRYRCTSYPRSIHVFSIHPTMFTFTTPMSKSPSCSMSARVTKVVPAVPGTNTSLNLASKHRPGYVNSGVEHPAACQNCKNVRGTGVRFVRRRR